MSATSRRYRPLLCSVLATVCLSLIGASSPLSWLAPVLEPPNGSPSASPGVQVAIEYDETIDPASVSPSTFVVHAAQRGRLDGARNAVGGRVSLFPADLLRPGEEVEAIATTGLANLAGDHPPRPTVWRFRIASASGGGAYPLTHITSASGVVWATRLGDLDGDGDLDLYLGREASDKVWLSDGYGNWVDTHQELGTSGRTQDAALGDVDGDGDLDAVTVRDANGVSLPSMVWLNDGWGYFSEGSSFLSSRPARTVELGDLDGDGDLDVVRTGTTDLEIWLNQGGGQGGAAGTFVLASVYPEASDGFASGLGDLDGDGDLDLFVARGHDLPNKVLLNGGAGHFTDSGQALGTAYSTALALGDLDGDGDLDAFVGNSFDTPADEIWTNDGAALFSDSGVALGGDNTPAAAVGDVNGDGALDLFTGEFGGRVWLNDGGLSFVDTGLRFGNMPADALAIGSLTGRLRADLVVEMGPIRTFVNVPPSGMECRGECGDTSPGCPASCMRQCPDEITHLSGADGSATSVDLDVLVALREGVLRANPVGQRHVEFYEAQGSELVELIVAHPALWDEGLATLLAWQPNLAALVAGQGGATVVSASQIQQVDDFLASVSALASPSLQQAISEERSRVGPLTAYVGLTMEEARRAALGEPAIFWDGFEAGHTHAWSATVN